MLNFGIFTKLEKRIIFTLPLDLEAFQIRELLVSIYSNKKVYHYLL